MDKDYLKKLFIDEAKTVLDCYGSSHYEDAQPFTFTEKRKFVLHGYDYDVEAPFTDTDLVGLKVVHESPYRCVLSAPTNRVDEQFTEQGILFQKVGEYDDEYTSIMYSNMGVLDKPCLVIAGNSMAKYCHSFFKESCNYDGLVYVFDETSMPGVGVSFKKGWYAANSETFANEQFDLEKHPFYFHTDNLRSWSTSEEARDYLMNEVFSNVNTISFTIKDENIYTNEAGTYVSYVDTLGVAPAIGSIVLELYNNYYGKRIVSTPDDIATITWEIEHVVDGESVSDRLVELTENVNMLTDLKKDYIGVLNGDLRYLVIPDGVKYIKNYAFSQNQYLREVYIPEGVTGIGSHAFYYCSSLESVHLPTSMSYIGDYAFCDCNWIESLRLPDNITTISDDAFRDCYKLSITHIPENVTHIGDRAFYFCHALENITFKGTPDRISDTAFEGCHYITTINVPWAEGEVSGAPWGATNATINYNYNEG